ncbi:amino acid racemase [Marivita sp. XM-24bin2]|jgi:aspartate racemase|uniref:aspartate/glutamate racemase family protein n=1 Tax=unclassified Marivita TaxID=2632480 RepID=UPI000D7A27AD|nr:amino acid racemase [Marivita sp. XM-24bin2]MCR9109658.1 amino acid racemase [Paracoccaceae bacterium]PWL34978.1 MAG: aspartate racemase [Marivita sp. XM-24bin2]
MRRIGVLGGMGPEATIYFMQQVVGAISARDDSDHIPLLVDNNTQVPSRIKAILEGGGEDPSPVLAQMAEGLVAAGAEALVMPCNTAHYYADQVAAATDVPFLNMVELSCAEAAEIAPGGKVGLLGSPALQQVGVFEKALSDVGLSPVYATEQGRVLATIRSIKSQGPSEFAAHTLSDVASQMVADGADVVCICCTEFSLLAAEIDVKVPMFDALQVLVSAAVEYSRTGVSSPAMKQRDTAPVATSL